MVLFAAVTAALITVGFAKTAITPEIDPQLSQNSMTAWLMYLGARQTYHEQHKLPIPRSGEVVPTFAEEVEAFGMALAMGQVTGATRDPYWSVIAKVSEKGFLKAYIWTYVHRPSWPDTERPRNLAAFQKWARSALPNHRPVHVGRLIVK